MRGGRYGGWGSRDRICPWWKALSCRDRMGKRFGDRHRHRRCSTARVRSRCLQRPCFGSARAASARVQPRAPPARSRHQVHMESFQDDGLRRAGQNGNTLPQIRGDAKDGGVEGSTGVTPAKSKCRSHGTSASIRSLYSGRSSIGLPCSVSFSRRCAELQLRPERAALPRECIVVEIMLLAKRS
eukprot:SAG11_NODE_289_length_11184_cov_20.648083_6_plen_184_part_00